MHMRQLHNRKQQRRTKDTVVENVGPQRQQQPYNEEQLPPPPFLSPLITEATVGFSTSLDLLARHDDNDDDDDYNDSTITDDSDDMDVPSPPTQSLCLHALHDLLTNLEFLSVLAVATEASSHPTGLISILAQPWLYAGGGLGNENECTSIAYKPSSPPTTLVVSHVMQTCLAGAARRRDAALPFAGLCWPSACDAVDLQHARHTLLPALKKIVASHVTPAPNQGNDNNDNDNALNSASAAVLPQEEQISRLHQHSNKTNATTTSTTIATPSAKPAKDSETASKTANTNATTQSSWWNPTPAQMAHQQGQLALEYVTALQHMVDINHFLGTQWTCGNFTVPWNTPLAGPFAGIVTALIALCAMGTTTWFRPKKPRPTCVVLPSLKRQARNPAVEEKEGAGVEQEEERMGLLFYSDDAGEDDDEEKKHDGYCYAKSVSRSLSLSSSSPQLSPKKQTTPSKQHQEQQNPFWSAFDVSKHLERLTTPHSSDTACLDGLRVFSVVWIVMGHVMAIVSSTGAGYSNPAHFMPPEGLTTKWFGQLLFSSRMSVDTFLIISGFLVVHVLKRKLVPPTTAAPATLIVWQYLRQLPALLLTRVVRILPLYALTLGFYTLIAPHMGSGPFWYQWLGLLKPCRDYWWTNFLFINNFWPPDRAVVDTCFYHSWYLAVDMQLFLVAPLLVMMYQAKPDRGRIVAAGLFVLSVVTTVYLSWSRQWSMNTFDGAAVARYDMEAYAKPHIRAQAYLAGMFVAMILPSNEAAWKRRAPWAWKHQTALLAAIGMLLFVAFVTGTGAYGQRPCQYQEFPGKGLCGSSWPAWGTFLYTAFGRTIWIVGISLIIHLCIGQRCSPASDCIIETEDSSGPSGIHANNFLSFVLSWKCWTPLSQLSFGVYLIHPVVIFIWQLGGRDKDVFRLLTFGLDLVSVCVVSYVAALMASLVVEFPCAALWKNFVVDKLRRKSSQRRPMERLAEASTRSLSSHNDDSSPRTNTLVELYGISYGSVSPVNR